MPSPRYCREIPNRYRLEASKCSACGKVSFPARPICPGCRATTSQPVRLSWKGRVITSTVVHVAPPEFAMQAPYAVAIVETPEGARLTTQVVDLEPAEVKPGMEVSLAFRLVRKEGHGGILCYGFKGVPAD